MFVVKYSGPFGFIKPWTAVRDSETFSQQFLTPSIIEGIEKKLFPELLKEKGIHKIKRHRLRYKQMAAQQEQIQPRGWNKKKNHYERPYAILTRSVMIEPELLVAFDNSDDANEASKQHICLCRNEDIVYPDENILEIAEKEFDTNEDLFSGFELIFIKSDQSFLVGYNRMNDNIPMYGYIKIVGHPVRRNYE